MSNADQPMPGKTQATEATFYVATNGNDAWSGNLSAPNVSGTNGPLATLGAARDAARRLGTTKARRIVVREGEYFLQQPLVLDARDSRLSIEAAPDEKVVLYGGRRITDWAPDGEQFWAADLPEVAMGQWDFRMLVVNGRFCKWARLPETGYFTHLSEFEVPWDVCDWQRKPTYEELTALKYRPKDLGPELDIANAEITVYHSWDESLVGVAARDEATNTLTFSNPAGHPPGGWGLNTYVVWNIRQGMTQPGQWYLDRTAGKVVYWPLPDEDITTAEVLAPTIERIIRLEGTEGNPVEDVTLRGLTVSVTTTPLITGGFGAGAFDGAISVNFAHNCRLLDLTLMNIGGQGIKAENCTALCVQQCQMHHAGAGGIKASGTDTLISDNHVYSVGLTYPSAIGIWSEGEHAQTSHNEVHDTPYSAIVITDADNHLVANNRIYRAMQELGDGAAIYGSPRRAVIRGNFVSDIVPAPHAAGPNPAAHAYYLDIAAEDCLVEGNLAVGVPCPILNHMARKNTIRNNVFISDTDAMLQFQRCSDYRFEKNVVWARGKITVEGPEAITESSANIFFSESGVVRVHRLAPDAYQTVEVKPLEEEALDTLQADPLLIDVGEGAYRFAPESPALKLGFEPIDVSDAGPRR